MELKLGYKYVDIGSPKTHIMGPTDSEIGWTLCGLYQMYKSKQEEPLPRSICQNCLRVYEREVKE